jgi:hypothetical protein
MAEISPCDALSMGENVIHSLTEFSLLWGVSRDLGAVSLVA